MNQSPTAAELKRHRSAVERIRAELFKIRTPESLHIKEDSETIIPAHVTVRYYDYGPNQKTERKFFAGGLKYLAASPRRNTTYEISVSHAGGKTMNLFLVYHVTGPTTSVFTRFSMSRPWRQLHAEFVRMIEQAWVEDSQFLAPEREAGSSTQLARNL